MMTSADGKVLLFKKPMPPYNPGETAGFPHSEADRILLMNGVAEIDPRPFIPPSRSAGLEPPAFSMQALATIMADATREIGERPNRTPKA